MEAPPKKQITTQDVIYNFAFYKKHLVSSINRFFNLWADKQGPGCVECQQLSALFARAIDSAKTGKGNETALVTNKGDVVKIPQNLRIEAPEKPEIKFVWQKLKISAQQVGNKLKEEGLKSENTYLFTKQTLRNLLLERKVGISDFELLKFVHLWCRLKEEDLSDYW